MKNAKEILNIIQNKPQFSKLTKFMCIQRIQKLFSPALQKMVKFAYIKEQTLFFVLNHPGAKQEFDNNIQSIKSALNFAPPAECEATPIKDIKAFVTHTPMHATPSVLQIKPQVYTERAAGNFSIDIQDEKLSNLVKTIRDIIRKEPYGT